MDGEKNLQYLEQALSGVPVDFRGKLLEVPVGTGVLTMPLYASLPDAAVTCLDYSAGMMENAKKRAAVMNISNVAFVQGDVGALPFEDESFDLVLSLNGFHAFPDKAAAYASAELVIIATPTNYDSQKNYFDTHPYLSPRQVQQIRKNLYLGVSR